MNKKKIHTYRSYIEFCYCFHYCCGLTFIIFLKGPALETVKRLVAAGERFDMMFLDGDKKDYIDLVKVGLSFCFHDL